MRGFEGIVMATNDDSDRPLIHDRDQREKRGLQFLAFCVIVTALLFILIDVVAYFKGATGAVPDSADAHRALCTSISSSLSRISFVGAHFSFARPNSPISAGLPGACLLKNAALSRTASTSFSNRFLSAGLR